MINLCGPEGVTTAFIGLVEDWKIRQLLHIPGISLQELKELSDTEEKKPDGDNIPPEK